MIDFDRIPRVTYFELVELVGGEEAEKKIKELGYDYQTIVRLIVILRAKRTFSKAKYAMLSTSITGIVIKVLILYGFCYLVYYILKDTAYF